MKKMHYKNGCQFIIIVFAMISLSSALFSQKITQEHFSLEQGLSSRLVESTITDSIGLVWVGTSNGLNRFDGYEFVSFYADKRTAAASRLSHNHVIQLNLAKDGQVAVLYKDLYSSFDLFHPNTLKVTKVEAALGLEGQPRKIYVDQHGDVFVFTIGKNHSALYQFDFKTMTFELRFRMEEVWTMLHPDVSILHLADGTFMLHDTEHGLRLLDENGTKRYEFSFSEITADSILKQSTAMFLKQSKSGQVWIAQSGFPGLFYWEKGMDDFTFAPGFSSEHYYGNLWEDDSGNILINQILLRGNYPGSSHLWLRTAEGNVFNYSKLLEYGIYIQSISGDNFERSMFFGKDTGLQIFQHSFARVTRFLDQDIREDRRGYSMRGITGDGGNHVYIAREVSRWYSMDLETDIIDTIFLHKEGLGEIIDFTCGLGLFYDEAGFLWGVSCDGTIKNAGNILRYDIEQCTTRVFTFNYPFSAVTQLKNGNLLLGEKSEDGQGRLLLFDIETESMSTFTSSENEDLAFPIIKSVLPSSDGHYWIGTDNGLFELDESRTLQRQFRNGSAEKSLSDNSIYCLYEDIEKNLWIGTKNGLTVFYNGEPESATYNTEDGLASSTIAAILPGEEGSLWISTYNGLSYFNPNKDLSRRFYRIDGFSHNEFNRYSAFIDSKGRYYFGGVNGINTFFPDELLVERDIPSVVFSGFIRYDEKLDSLVEQYHDLGVNKEIIVEPHYSFTSLDFTLPIYKPTMKNQFRYQIGDEANGDWIYLKEGRSMSFNNMKPGRYNIYVQGADPNGNWGTETLELHLLVKEVFYKTWWFFTLLSLFVLLATYGFLRWRWDQKLEVEKLRTQLASDLHDEVSGLLAGISLQTELLRDHISDELLKGKLQRITEASQRAMVKMSDVIWSIDSRRDRFIDLINRMEEHADEVLLPINIKYKIEVSFIEKDQLMPANIRQELYFIFKECINNVAKHSNASVVQVKMENQNSDFRMVIRDNGNRILDNDDGTLVKVRKRKRKGQGMSNLKMRTERLGAKLRIQKVGGYTISLKMKRFL